MEDSDLNREFDQDPVERDVEEAFETYGFDRDEPGSTLLWFGKHEGKRMGSIPEDYRWVVLGYCLQNPWNANVSQYLVRLLPS